MKNKSTFTFAGYILFFIPLSIIVTFSILLFNAMITRDLPVINIVLCLLIYIVFATLVFCLFDVIRRRIMVDRPLEQILNATEQISKGNLKVKLIPLNPYSRYTEYDVIMENINKMTDALSKNEVLKTEFISNLSHEIKTPLTVIQSHAKALSKKGLDEATKKEYLLALISSTARLSNLVTNILKLSKLENQTTPPTVEKIDAAEVLRQNILQYEQLYEEKNIELSLKIAETSLIISPSHLDIIFSNLISNAIKFTENNGKIEICLLEINNQIIFSVKDNGCGMDEKTGAQIFDKFYQGDTSHASEGNGLGLALVKKVVDIIGGEIEVSSKQGEGSTFTVKLKRN